MKGGKGKAKWQKVPGGAVRIAVGPGEGNAWIVNSGGRIYNYSEKNKKWLSMPGRAKDIGVGADNTMWVIGATKEGKAGYGIYRMNSNRKGYKKIPGSAEKISVDKSGNAWVA